MYTCRSTVLLLNVALGATSALAASPAFLKTIGPTPDGKGARVVLAGSQRNAQTIARLDREVREAYDQLHPQHGSYMVTFGINAEGNIEAAALPYVAEGKGPPTQVTGPE